MKNGGKNKSVAFIILFSINNFLKVGVTSGAGPRAVGTERGRWSK